MSEKASISHTEKTETRHIDYTDEKNVALTSSDEDLGHYIADAAAAAEQQKNQSTRGALAMWKPAVIWSIVFSTAIVMEGYDTCLLVRELPSYDHAANALNKLLLSPVTGPVLGSACVRRKVRALGPEIAVFQCCHTMANRFVLRRAGRKHSRSSDHGSIGGAIWLPTYHAYRTPRHDWIPVHTILRRRCQDASRRLLVAWCE